MRPLLDPLGQAAGWRGARSGRVSLATTTRTPASHGRRRGRDSPPSPFARSLPLFLPPFQTDTLLCLPALDSDSSSGCSLQPLLPPLPPLRWLLRWLSLRCPNPGVPGPDSAGFPSPAAGIMRATETLQVLGFLLSLARGSEVGNSQTGKPRRSPSRLETGSATRAHADPGQGVRVLTRRAGRVRPRICWDHHGGDGTALFSEWARLGPHS